MPIYKLPLGIRVPRHDEYPLGNDIEQIEKDRDAAEIVQGYKISDIKCKKFSFFAEINIDCDKLLNLFINLANAMLPEVAYGVFAFKGEKHILSQFINLNKIIELYRTFSFELVNDGFLEFGIAHYDDNTLNEILVSSFKYFKVWGTDKTKFTKIMNQFGLLEIEDIGFIDEFPVISEALSIEMIPGIKRHTEVYEAIKTFFANSY